MGTTKVLTSLDYRALKYCNLFLAKFRKRAKLTFLVTAIFSIGIGVYGLIVMDNLFFVVLGVLFIVYFGYQFLNFEKKLDVSLSRFFANRPVTTQLIDIDTERIIVTRSIDVENPMTYDWSFVTEICEMPQYYMLMIGKGSPIIIDRRLEAIQEGTKENLDNIIKEKVQLKPYKRTDEDIVKIPITYVHPEFPTAEAVEVENEAKTINSEEETISSEEEKKSEE